MIGVLIAVLLAALAYTLCMALQLPAIVAIVAAVIVLVGGIPSGGFGLGGGLGDLPGTDAAPGGGGLHGPRPVKMIGIEFEMGRRGLVMRAPADVENLPVARQAFRAFAQLLDMPEDALGEAELGVTEAVSNVIKHAYGENGDGELRLELALENGSLLARVTDTGGGIPEEVIRDGRSEDGFGLILMNGVAGTMRLDSSSEGTEVELEFVLDRPGPAPGSDPPFEAILRRVLTVLGAQADLSVDRLTEAALAGELLARHSAGSLEGNVLEVRMDRSHELLRVHAGPYVSGGAENVLAETEAPVVGRVLEKLADHVAGSQDESGAEWLELRMGEDPGSAR